MTPLSKEFLRNWRSYHREGMTIMMLEKELKKRKILQAKARTVVEKMQPFQKSVPTEIKSMLVHEMREVKENVAVAISARWDLGDKAWVDESLDPVDAFFDFGPCEKPNVALSQLGDSQSLMIINIGESVKRDPKNIGNPLIMAALERYLKCLGPRRSAGPKKRGAKTASDDTQASLFGPTSEQAEKSLNRIFRSMKAGAQARSGQRSRPREIDSYIDWLTSDFNDEYFEKISSILKEQDIRSCEGIKTIWRSRIRLRLRALMPDLDHRRVLDFIADTTLPRTRTTAALRNAFFAWSNNLPVRSFSKYKSQGSKALRKRLRNVFPEYDSMDLDEAIGSFSAKAADGFILKLGIGKVEFYDDVRASSLVWEVKQPDSTDSAESRQVKVDANPESQTP